MMDVLAAVTTADLKTRAHRKFQELVAHDWECRPGSPGTANSCGGSECEKYIFPNDSLPYYSYLRFDRPFPIGYSPNSLFNVYLLMVLGSGTSALEHLPTLPLGSSRQGTRFSRSFFGLQGRQRPPIHARDMPWFS